MAARASNPPLVSRRALAAGVLAAVSAVALPGCVPAEGDAGSGSAAVGTAAADEPLRIAVRTPSCIDPYNCQTDSDRQIVWQLFDPLTVYDFEQGEPVGRAAASWDVSDDACTFTFHLVEGATFHNGDPVDARSFKRAWNRIASPESAVASRYGASSLGYLLALVEGYEEVASGAARSLSGVSCPDDLTLVVALVQPYADFACVVAHPALAPVPRLASYSPSAFYLAPVGNGPFKLAEGSAWEAGEDVELVRFEDYCGEPAAIDALRFVMTDDADDAYRSLQAGDLDVADVPIDEISSARKGYGASSDGCTMSDEERLVIGAEPAVGYLACNLAREPFSDADVRRAASMAIDRDALCKNVYKRTRFAAGGIVPAGVAGYRADAWACCEHDVEQAEALLQGRYPAEETEAGELERSVPFELVYYEDGGHGELVELLADDLAEVGLVAEAVPLGWEALQERLAAGEFDLALLSWTMDFPAMDNVLYPLLHSDSLGGTNVSGYESAEVDAAIDEARALVEADARVERLQEAEDLVAADVPVIPLLFYGHTLAGSERIGYLYCDPQGRIDAASVELV